jgi:hypothetical protein
MALVNMFQVRLYCDLSRNNRGSSAPVLLPILPAAIVFPVDMAPQQRAACRTQYCTDCTVAPASDDVADDTASCGPDDDAGRAVISGTAVAAIVIAPDAVTGINTLGLTVIFVRECCGGRQHQGKSRRGDEKLFHIIPFLFMCPAA